MRGEGIFGKGGNSPYYLGDNSKMAIKNKCCNCKNPLNCAFCEDIKKYFDKS